MTELVSVSYQIYTTLNTVYLFTAFLGGFVALMEKSGGFGGFADAIGKFAKNARIGQFVTFLSGGIIFFDDYANCLVVGGSLRPILDELNVSREKLAFIVDATAAPIASLVPLSSVSIQHFKTNIRLHRFHGFDISFYSSFNL